MVSLSLKNLPPAILKLVRDPQVALKFVEDRLGFDIEDLRKRAPLVDVQLTVAGKNVTDFLETWTITHEENGAITLDATLSKRWPYEAINAPVKMRNYLGSQGMDVFYGSASVPILDRASTQGLSHSPFPDMERVKLKKRIDYTGTPSQLVRQVLTKNTNLYNPGLVRVADLGPHVQKEEDEGFEEEQSIQDVLSAVQDETGCVFADTESDGIRVFKPPLGNPSEAVFSYEADDSIDRDGWKVEGLIEEMFSEVIALKKAEDEATDDLGNPAPIPGWRFIYPIQYPIPFQPPRNTADYLVFTSDDETTPAQAKQKAIERKRLHERTEAAFTLVVPYNPFLRLHDTIRVGEDAEDNDGKWRFEWLCVLDSSIAHQNVDITTLTGSARLLAHPKFTRHSIEPVLPHTVSLVKTPGPVYGFDIPQGLWIDPDRAVGLVTFWAGFDTGPPGPFWVDDLEAGGTIGFDEGGMYIIAPNIPFDAFGMEDSQAYVTPEKCVASGITRFAGEDSGGLWFDFEAVPGISGEDSGGAFINF